MVSGRDASLAASLHRDDFGEPGPHVSARPSVGFESSLLLVFREEVNRGPGALQRSDVLLQKWCDRDRFADVSYVWYSRVNDSDWKFTVGPHQF